MAPSLVEVLPDANGAQASTGVGVDMKPWRHPGQPLVHKPRRKKKKNIAATAANKNRTQLLPCQGVAVAALLNVCGASNGHTDTKGISIEGKK